MPISSKSLSPREQTRVRAALRDLATRYTNQTEFARALGVGQQTVSKTMREGTIGTKLAHRVAKLRHQTYEELLGGAPARRVYVETEGWVDAAREAVEHGSPSAGVAAVAQWPASLPLPSVEPWRMVADLAGLWLRWGTSEEREQEETADAAREAEAFSGPADKSSATSPRGGRKTS